MYAFTRNLPTVLLPTDGFDGKHTSLPTRQVTITTAPEGVVLSVRWAYTAWSQEQEQAANSARLRGTLPFTGRTVFNGKGAMGRALEAARAAR